ncbi:S8 family serine peptidase [Omnitrophica bacterium]|nr:S8 family serine peptidase [Candidatus Omnitrophota bacterium]
MKIKRISKLDAVRVFFLVSFVILLISLDTGAYAEKAKKLSRHKEGEIIIKLKSEEPLARRATESYDLLSKKDLHIIEKLRKTYKISGERPLFKKVHHRLKRRNSSIEELIARQESSLSGRRRRPSANRKLANLFSIYTLETEGDVLKLCERLRKDPEVAYAAPNYLRKAEMVPDDPYYDSAGSWGQPYDDLWGLKKINCEDAWDISQGEGVIVAIIDTGVDYDHEDIKENIWTNEDEIAGNNIDDDDNGYIDDIKGWDFAYGDSDPRDKDGHGTHCAGIISAIGNNGIGIIGTAPMSKIMVLQGLDETGYGYDSNLAECIVYAADNGADILSNSWGGWGESQLLEDAFNYAYSKGCISFTSAGNNNDDVRYYYPAAIETVIAVSATTHDDKKSTFSNWGSFIDVAAPGTDILSLRATDTTVGTPVGENYTRADGTSMASPHVAGIAALMLSDRPELGNDEIRTMIQISSDDIGVAGKDDYFGYGRVNAFKACTVGRSSILITSPNRGSYVRGDVYITGSAFMEDSFNKYELYCRSEDNPEDTKLIAEAMSPVEEGLLGEWDTTQFEEGEYLITLRVLHSASEEFLYSIKVIIDNINEPPEFINLTSKGVIIGRDLKFTVEACDPDDPDTPEGQITGFSAYNLPPYANFNLLGEGVFDWHPPDNYKGIYKVDFTVSDNENTTKESIDIFTMYIEMEQITNDSFDQFDVRIYDNRIVWTDARDGNRDIYMYDIYNKREEQITDDPDDQYEPGIYKDKIVWTDERNGNGDIFIYDISKDQEVKRISDPNRQSQPCIYEDKVVWVDERNGNEDIYMYDISEGEERQITYDVHKQSQPGIYGDRIVWSDERNIDPERWFRNRDIYMYDLSLDQEKQITTSLLGQFSPAIYKDTIAFIWEYAIVPRWVCGLFTYDISTGEETSLTCEAPRQVFPDIYEDRIVYYGGAAHGIPYFSLFLYDISTGQEFRIFENLYSNADYPPDIYGDKIVWSDGYFENGEVFMLKIFLPPQIMSINPTKVQAGSSVTVKGKDFGYGKDENSRIIFDRNVIAHEIISWKNDEIVCVVPEGAQAGTIRLVTPGGECLVKFYKERAYIYDINNRISRIVYPDGGYWLYTEYTSDGKLKAREYHNPDGSVYRKDTLYYDEEGNYAGERREYPTGNTYHFDAQGRLIKKIYPDGSYWLYTKYTADNKVEEIEYHHPDGSLYRKDTFYYDEEGNYAGYRREHPAGNTYHFDAQGRLTKKIYPDGSYWEFLIYTDDNKIKLKEYYLADNSLYCSDIFYYNDNGDFVGRDRVYANGDVVRYDSLNRKSWVYYSSGGFYRYKEYTADNKIKIREYYLETGSLYFTETYEYDAGGNLTGILRIYTDGREFHYDAATGTWTRR